MGILAGGLAEAVPFHRGADNPKDRGESVGGCSPQKAGRTGWGAPLGSQYKRASIEQVLVGPASDSPSGQSHHPATQVTNMN